MDALHRCRPRGLIRRAVPLRRIWIGGDRRRDGLGNGLLAVWRRLQIRGLRSLLRSGEAWTGSGGNGRRRRCWRDSRAPCGARVYLGWMRLGDQRRMAWSGLARWDGAWILRMVRNLGRMDVASSNIIMYWLLSARSRRARQVRWGLDWG